MRTSRFLPPKWFMILLVLSICSHYLVPVTTIIPSPVNLLGWVLILAGMGLNLWADKQFKKHKTTVKPYKKPSKLITKGAFSISRHPMYLGMAIILLGLAVASGAITTFAYPVIFVFLMEYYFIPFEEKMLEKQFKKKYKNYKKKVRKWI